MVEDRIRTICAWKEVEMWIEFDPLS
jgi:hypothetical protein